MATSSLTGTATWYRYAGQPSDECASPTLPMGTHLTVTDVATGVVAYCVVMDREEANRAVDLAPDVFEQLSDLSTGTVTVTVSW